MLLSVAAMSAEPTQRFARPIPSDGKRLFEAKCGLCHIGFAPGTITLGQRLGATNALLTARTDLKVDYVKAVVRNGIGAMPRFTRVDLSDHQLAKISTYLAADHRKATHRSNGAK